MMVVVSQAQEGDPPTTVERNTGEQEAFIPFCIHSPMNENYELRGEGWRRGRRRVPCRSHPCPSLMPKWEFERCDGGGVQCSEVGAAALAC